MSEERINVLTELLRGKSKEECERAFQTFGVTDEERTEVLRRLSEYRPSAPLSPKELRNHKYFRQLVVQARRGETVFFIGAGVSTDVGMPKTDKLRDALVAELKALGIQVSSDRPFAEAAGSLESALGDPGWWRCCGGNLRAL